MWTKVENLFIMFRNLIQFILFSFLLGLGQFPLAGQVQPVLPPNDLTASDGVYEKYVLIKWSPAKHAETYKVFRTTDPSKAPESLTKKWQQSTWLADYTAQPGVEYFYAVVGNNNLEISVLSNYDKGYLKPINPVANDTDMNTETVFAKDNSNPLMIGAITIENPTVKVGGVLSVSVELENLSNRDLSRPELRFFLSNDNSLSWDDELIDIKFFATFLAESSSRLDFEISIPDQRKPGGYSLIVVSSQESAILNSRIGVVSFDIIK